MRVTPKWLVYNGKSGENGSADELHPHKYEFHGFEEYAFTTYEGLPLLSHHDLLR